MPQSVDFSVATSANNEEWTVVNNSATDLTVTDGNTVVLASASAGGVTITLPSAGGSNKNRMIVVKKTDSTSNGVVIDPNGSETIDGDTTLTITTENASVMIVSDGSNWSIV